MASIILGTGPRDDVRIDVDLLLRSGLLIQANSGGGKSRTLRRLAEQLCSHVPTFIIDPEGEFATLREQFPFVLVRKEAGDVVADPRTAGAVVHKLLELGASAVFDIFDLSITERHQWVAAFLHAMDQAPKTLWRDVAVLVDEAHVYAPEKGKGESVALEPMAALASRGRKRGWGPIMATQRIAKFNKDVAAELKNLLVGLTFIGIDRARAREDLGVDRAERRDVDKQLRFMRPGHFFAFGHIFGTTDRIEVHVGSVASTHPDPAARKRPLQPPPPPAKIRALLAKLAELPVDAPSPRAAAAPDTGHLQAEVTRLRRELSAAAAAPAKVEQYPFMPPEVSDALGKIETDLARALTAVKDLRQLSRRLSSAQQPPAASATPPPSNGVPKPVSPPASLFAAPVASSKPARPPKEPGQLTRGAREILAVLAAAHPEPLTRLQIANRCVMTPKGSTLRTYLGHLLAARLIDRSGADAFALTSAGRATAGTPVTPDPRALVARWRGKLTGKAKDMLELFAREGRPLGREEIGARLEIDPAGSTFRTYLGHLQSNGLVRKVGGAFTVSPDLAH